MGSFAPELTFIPRRAPHEITSEAVGKRLVKRIQCKLDRISRQTNLWMHVKLDPFHDAFTPQQTWIVEVVPLVLPGVYWDTAWLDEDDSNHRGFMIAIDWLFRLMRDHGLVPYRTWRRGGVEYHAPGGGLHVHCGADLFPRGPTFYAQMERFHRDLTVDFANRPYIRWMLAQWSDDLNHETAVNEETLRAYAKSAPGRRVEDEIYSGSFTQCSIMARFMSCTKASYLTFELRFVDMVQSATELRAVVRLLAAWVEHHQMRTLRGDLSIPFTLTLADWRKATHIPSARRLCREWVKSLGLEWRDYAVFFERNLVRRIRFGKLT